MSETVVLCEGYHDRAFWKGWLTHLGCSDPSTPTGGKTARTKVLDPWKTPVKGGQYAYYSKSTTFIRVVPCGGKSKVLQEAKKRLSDIPTRPLLRLVIAIDPDTPSTPGTTPVTGLLLHHVEHLVMSFDPTAQANAEGEIELHGGTTRVGLVRWDVPDPSVPGVPDQQTLERLACAALTAAYPNRSQPVQAWLDGRPDKPLVDPKEYAWSHMAGWYADHGCEAFFTNLWIDARILAQLEARLRHSGAWQLVERITQ